VCQGDGRGSHTLLFQPAVGFFIPLGHLILANERFDSLGRSFHEAAHPTPPPVDASHARNDRHALQLGRKVMARDNLNRTDGVLGCAVLGRIDRGLEFGDLAKETVTISGSRGGDDDEDVVVVVMMTMMIGDGGGGVCAPSFEALRVAEVGSSSYNCWAWVKGGA
jgi:hypothetical protein